MANTSHLPLAGKRIVITRAPEQAADFVRQLEQLGAEVLLLPTVTFAEPKDAGPLDQAIGSLARFDWVLFTSQNAARFFARRCHTLGQTLNRNTARPLVGAVGPATAQAAREEGFRVHYVASRFRGTALAEELGAQFAGKKVLLPRSDRVGAELPVALRAAGAEVVEVVAYQTSVPESFDHRVADAIRRGGVDVISLFSPSAFHNLVEEVSLGTLHQHAARMVLAAVGPVTAGAIREAGLPVEIEAREAAATSLAAAIADYFLQRLSSGVESP